MTHARAACSLASAISRGSGGERAEALFREGMSLLPDRAAIRARSDPMPERRQHRGARELPYRRESRPRAAGAGAAAAAALSVRRAGAQRADGPGRVVPRAPASMARRSRRSSRRTRASVELGRENTENAGTLYNNWAADARPHRPAAAGRGLVPARDAHQQCRRHRQECLADGAQQPGGHADRAWAHRRGAALCGSRPTSGRVPMATRSSRAMRSARARGSSACAASTRRACRR